MPPGQPGAVLLEILEILATANGGRNVKLTEKLLQTLVTKAKNNKSDLNINQHKKRVLKSWAVYCRFGAMYLCIQQCTVYDIYIYIYIYEFSPETRNVIGVISLWSIFKQTAITIVFRAKEHITSYDLLTCLFVFL